MLVKSLVTIELLVYAWAQICASGHFLGVGVLVVRAAVEERVCVVAVVKQVVGGVRHQDFLL